MKSGFTLLEVLLSITILGVLVSSVYPIIGWLITRSKQLQFDSQAALVLQSGSEVAYNVFLNDWNMFGDGRYRYGLTYTNPSDTSSPLVWTLVPLAGGSVDEVGRFGRVIRVFTACRLENGTGVDAGKLQEPPEANPDCKPGYKKDSDSKMVVTSVDWKETSGQKHIEARLLITKL